MSMGLYNKYQFPHMYTSPQNRAQPRRSWSIMRVRTTSFRPLPSGNSSLGEFLEKGFTFFSLGDDLHHVP